MVGSPESGDAASRAGELADSIIPLYERYARVWDEDRHRASYNDRRWHERFAAALPGGAAVLDLGCGSGRPVASGLAARGFKVVGVDAAPSMIALCRERLPDQQWIVADMRRLALGRRFAGLLAWDSFFFLRHEDQRRMFAIFDAHAAQGSALMFNTGPAHGEAIGDYRGEPLYHASLDEREYKSLLERIGFEILEHVAHDARAGGRTVWLARRRAAASPAELTGADT